MHDFQIGKRIWLPSQPLRKDVAVLKNYRSVAYEFRDAQSKQPAVERTVWNPMWAYFPSVQITFNWRACEKLNLNSYFKFSGWMGKRESL